jgi:nucleotide-binding universal stress UspA family protein
LIVQVIVATDGSKASLLAAQQFKSFADPSKISEVVVVAVISPLAVVPFENELTHRSGPSSADEAVNLSFEAEARGATASLMAEFDGWGPAVSRRLRSGSPASEIIKVAARRRSCSTPRRVRCWSADGRRTRGRHDRDGSPVDQHEGRGRGGR